MSRIPHKPYKNAKVYDLDRFPSAQEIAHEQEMKQIREMYLQEPFIYAEDFVSTHEDWLKHNAEKYNNLILNSQEQIEKPKHISKYLNSLIEFIRAKHNAG